MNKDIHDSEDVTLQTNQFILKQNLKMPKVQSQ
jgi:hypothetical protein